MLVVLAAIPLLASGLYAMAEARHAQLEQRRAAAVDDAVGDLVLLSELRTRLLDERNWHAASGAIATIGLDPAQVLVLSGIDLPNELAMARAQVDVLFDHLALPEMAPVEAHLREVRSDGSPDLAAIGDAYRTLERETADVSERVLDELMVTAGSISDADGLIVSLRVLEQSTIARQAISAEFTGFFGVQFSAPAEPDEQLADLASARAVRTSALDQMDRILRPSSSAHAVRQTIAASSEMADFDDAVDQVLDHGPAPGVDDPDRPLEALGDLTRVAGVFRSSSASTELFFELVIGAGDDVLAASNRLSADAADRTQRALGSLVALVACSALLVVLARRSLVDPIVRLSDTARQIRDGNPSGEPTSLTGPTEIRHATAALNEAADQLQLAERQALALANGELGDPSLDQPSGGQLGASLQHAVRTLATSLHEREEFRRRMTHEATHDGLTQLPNRKAAIARLEQGLARTSRTGARLGVLFVDLDGFKDVNDHHGHPIGDAVLRVVARRLERAVRQGDHVGRLGGDEFVVIAEPVIDVDEAMAVANRVQRALARPMQIDSLTVTVNASVGVAVSSGSAADAGGLLRDADLAVYQAKREGKGQAALCTDELRSEMVERADMEQAIRNAIANDEFVLHYQPIVDRLSGRRTGLEALVRWKRPGIGLVAPASFIPFAERSDLIIAVDNWVLASVAEQIVRWEAAGMADDVSISVNISGRHLDSSDFVHDVLEPLGRYGIDPTRLVVEVTESALLDDLTAAASKLNLLRAHGIRTAIDDFGTGYTSLAHLKSLPVDILKIDRSFVSDTEASSLVKLIIDTGHLLGASVVAEGVETAEQADALSSMGTDKLQGYLFGRPGPAERTAEAIDPPTGVSER